MMSSSRYQILLLLIYLLLNDALSIDQSENIRILKKKRNSDQNEILVFGHRNPDTDAIASALVYASFLRQKQINAKAYRLGDLNNESKFVLERAGVSEPDMIPTDVADDTKVALVDHNESKRKISVEILDMSLFFCSRSTIDEKFK